MRQTFHRRGLIAGALGSAGAGGVLALGGCASAGFNLAPAAPRTAPRTGPTLPPIHASMDRVFDITVCTRPFRAMGPRQDAETVGDKFVVHNYGHGGSGWSLSWGSGQIALETAMSRSPKEIAVIGCGALGLTAATLAQEAGLKVTIYARDLLPDTRSARATGSWTPDSRIALESKAAPDFPARWERMARYSWKRYRRYLGLPGEPVEFLDQYFLDDDPPGAPAPNRPEDPLGFASYHERIRDLVPPSTPLPIGAGPFPTLYTRQASRLIFNVADYAHTLLTDFLLAGGRIERREFHAPADLATLKEQVVINCPGYGARTLWKDESITPVRGQIAWLPPQPEARYGLYYQGVVVNSRRDGVVVQGTWGGDMMGYGDDSEAIDRAEAERAIGVIQRLNGKVA